MPEISDHYPAAEPWRVTDLESPAKAHEAFKRFYSGLAAQLNLQTDQACADPSRYFPRTRHDGPPLEFCRITAERPRGNDTQAPPNDWFRRWSATHAQRFEVVEALKVRAPVAG
jgi:hypothetical protein